MAHFQRPTDPRDFEIAFLCVLKVERDAIELALDEEYEADGLVYARAAGDTNAYTTGRMGQHHVVIVYLPGVGNIGAAAAAASVPATFPGIKLAIVVGVCGVSPDSRDHDEQEVLLGDVIVSTTVLRVSYGHQYPDGFILRREEDTLRLAPVAIRTFLRKLEGIRALRRIKEKIVIYTENILDQGLRQRGAYPGPELDKLYSSEYRHKHRNSQDCPICSKPGQVCQYALGSPCTTLGCDNAFLVWRPRLQLAHGFCPNGTLCEDRDKVRTATQPLVIFGKFASGEAVMKSGGHRDMLAAEHGVVGFEMEGAGSWDYLPTMIVKGACDYADSHKNKVWQQYSAITAAACAKAIVEEWGSNFIQQQPEISKEIQGIPRVMDACFDSQKLQDTPTCLSNTRVSLLEEIRHWATKADAEPVFWLQGVAGSGKTTIAKTVAEISSRDGYLGASFFFSRQGGDRGNATNFFATVAYQLAVRLVSFRSFLEKALVSHRDIFGKSYKEQWEQLILDPMLQLEQHSNGEQDQSVVVVVDAVDECEPLSDIGIILGLLIQAKKLKTVPLRFLLTGRPEESVHYGFRRIRDNVDQIILHQIESDLVNADIRRFVQHEFDQIQERNCRPVWYTPEQLDRIVSKSDGLFIYAATLSRSLSRSRYPNLNLAQLLERDSSTLTHLNQIYRFILTGSAPERWDDDIKDVGLEIFKLIVGSLATLFDTLSINTLHHLLASDSASFSPQLDPVNIEATIISLGSVIDIPYAGDIVDRNGSIRIFHPSFREFVLNQRELSLQHLQLDSGDLHEKLLSSCLAVMDRYLRKNLCLLSALDTDPRTLSSDLMEKYIPLDVQYACKYWISHAEKVSERRLQIALADNGPVHRFIQRKAVYWFEVLGLLQIVPHAVTSIVGLRALVDSKAHPNNAALIQDTHRFLITNRAVIAEAPLQIYCSSLLFSPSNSLLKNLFSADILPWLQRPPDVPVLWPSSVSFEASHEDVLCVDFSPDGQTLVAGYADGSILFWDIATGFLHQTIHGSYRELRSVVYSNDGRNILTGSFYGPMCLYEVSTGTLLCKQKEPYHIVGDRAIFSADGRLILTGHKQAGIWESDTTVLRHSLKGHTGFVRCLSFTPNSQSAVTGCCDSKIRVFDCNTGSLQYVLDTRQSEVFSLTFCNAGNIFVTTIHNKTIQSWDPSVQKMINSVQNIGKGTFEIAVSPDGKLMATNSDYKDIQIWNAMSFSIFLTLREHFDRVSSLKFSCDSRLLASGSWDGTVRLWDLNDNIYQEKICAHKEPVSGVKFSPCGMILASCSRDATVQVYDLMTERSHCVLKMAGMVFEGLSFMPNGSLLVVAGVKGGIHLLNTRDWSHRRISGCDRDLYSRAVTFSADGRFLAGGHSSGVDIWDTTNWELIRTLETRSHATWNQLSFFSSVEFSPDGRYLACGSSNNSVYLFDLQENRKPDLLHPQFTNFMYPRVKALSFSPDGLQLACRNFSGETNFWVCVSPPGQPKKDWIKKSTTRNLLVTPKMFLQGTEARWAIEGEWITFLGQRILYLPKNRRVTSCDIFGNTIAIGSASGMVTILRFRDDLDRFVVDTCG
ncbi:hypothetical protein BJY01DRAFT_132276 [Aspergillus pseudoustus]|uniref:NACHT domain-containing protein n=1 Tax=Aspergillus pseudoustus TaxID=1810923 RepID=A0ABR4KG40_9EURO